MLLRRCLRSVNSTRSFLTRALSTDNSNDSTPSTPENQDVPPDNQDVPPDEELEEMKFVKIGDELEPDNETDEISEQRKIDQEKCHREMVDNLSSLHSMVVSHHAALRLQSLKDRPITRDDFFNVKSLFTLRDLFDSRVHLGHHIGCWHPANKKYLYGIRNNMHIIDIASSEQHLWRALHLVSLLVYSGGSVLFVNNRPGYRHIVQAGASSCTERYWTKAKQLGVYEEPDLTWFDKNKPDLVICSSVNNPVSQKLLLHCNKYLVPTIGILDSDVDPTNLTYVIPGNDDSSQSLVFYHAVFARAIQRAKLVTEALQLETTASVKHARDSTEY